MLDRSIPYFNLIMRRRAGLPIAAPQVPPGYSFVYYEPGMESAWAAIETAVGEFDDEREAAAYFNREYASLGNEVCKRTIFVQQPSGELIGTVTAWWHESDRSRVASLHWLGVKPGYQRQGIGKALVYQCLHVLREMEGDVDVFLHTQTWSWQAVALYEQTGFELLESETFGAYKNEYKHALPILKAKLKGE